MLLTKREKLSAFVHYDMRFGLFNTVPKNFLIFTSFAIAMLLQPQSNSIFLLLCLHAAIIVNAKNNFREEGEGDILKSLGITDLQDKGEKVDV